MDASNLTSTPASVSTSAPSHIPTTTTPTFASPPRVTLARAATTREPPGTVGTAELDVLGERIATLSAQISAATYQLLVLIREFDDRDGWNTGFLTCAHWLSWRTGLAPGPAREKVRVARALGGLPRISDAMRRGELSYSKVRALTRVATPETEQTLLDFARAGTASQVDQLVRGWRHVDQSIDQQQREEAERHARRSLDVFQDDDGMYVIRGRVDSEVGAVLVKALEAAGQVLYDETREQGSAAADGVPATHRRAEALGRVAEAALAGGLDRGTCGDRYQVVVHVDAEVLADSTAPGTSVLDGHDVPAGTSRRLACEASRVMMTHDTSGRVLDVGRKTRVIPPGLRRALAHRDRTCQFPGCDRTLCDAHHVQHWADGGPTSLENLMLLCRRHHRCVHEEGYTVERQPDGTTRFITPQGRVIPPVGPPLHLPNAGANPMTAVEAEFMALGVTDAPPFPDGDGRRLDLGWALDVIYARQGAACRDRPVA